MSELYKIKGVEVQGHIGTWYNVSEGETFIINDIEETLYIFEHEEYGGQAANVIANKQGKLFMENVWNGWSDWKEYAPSGKNITIQKYISI